MSESKQPNMLLRWVLVLSVLGVFAVGVAGFLFATDRMSERKADQALNQANARLAEGNVAAAIPLMETYLAKYPENVSVLAGYAGIVQQVPLPNDGHYRKAMKTHQRLLALEPNRMDSVLALLDIYDKANMGTEAIKQATFVLEKRPSMLRAHAIKAKYLAKEGDYDQAYAVLDDAMAIQPMAIETNRLRLDLMTEQDLRTSQKLAWVEDLLAKHSQDPRGQLLKAYALVTGEPAERQAAIGIMDGLALGDGASGATYELALAIYDAMGRFDDAIALTREAIESHDHADLKPALIKRLWDAQQPEEISTLFEGPNAWAFEDVASQLPLLAWSYQSLGDQDAFESLVDQRREQTKSRHELLWYELLELIPRQASEQPVAAQPVVGSQDAKIKALIREGLGLFPSDPYLHHFAGQMDAREGKYQSALGHWQAAAKGARSWNLPRRLIVAGLLRSNQAEQAYAIAYSRYFQGLDQSGAMLLLYLQAAQAMLEELPPKQFLLVAEVVDNLQTQQALKELLPLQIKIMAMQGDEQRAKTLLVRTLEKDTDLGNGTLLELARISEAEQFGLTEEILEQLKRTHGASPQVAMFEAMQVFSKGGDLNGAKALFDGLRPKQMNEKASLAWDLAWAKTLERIAPSAAKDEWSRMVGRHGQNYEALKTAINAPGVWVDLKLAGDVLKRLEKVAGEEDYEVRLAKTRLALGEMDKAPVRQKERLLGETALALADLTKEYPYMLMPNVLMGEVQMRLGKAGLAAQYFGEALRLAPDRYDLLIKQASASRQAGQQVAAESLLREHEEQFANNGQALLVMAAWWRETGSLSDAQRCVAMAAHQLPDNRLLQLEDIHLLAASGRIGLAVERLASLLESPTPETVLLAAKLFGHTNDQEGLRAAFAATEKIANDLKPAEVAWLQAEIHWRLGEFDLAESEFQKAMGDSQIVNKVAKSWLTLALEAADKERFKEALSAASGAIGLQQPLLDLLSEHQTLLDGLTGETKNLLLEAVNGIVSPEDTLSLLGSVGGVAKGEAAWGSVLPVVKAIAEDPANQQSAAVQVLHVATLLRLNELAMAEQVASAAGRRFAKNPQINLLNLTIAIEQSDWEKVLQRSQALAPQGGEFGRLAIINGVRAALRLGRGQVASDLLGRFQPSANLSEEEQSQLMALSIVSGYTQGVLPTSVSNSLDQVVLTASGRQQLLANLMITQPPAPSIVLLWMDKLDESFASLPAGERIRLAAWMRSTWGRFRMPDMATKCQNLLELLLENEETAESSALMLGQMAEVKTNWQQAADCYEMALEKNPNNLLALNNSAMVYSHLSMHAKALDAAQRAKALAPEAAFVLDTLALVNLAAGEFVAAVKAIEQAIELEPQNPAWQLTALDCHLQAGNVEKAENMLSGLMKMQQDGLLNPEQRERVREMQSQLRELNRNAVAA